MPALPSSRSAPFPVAILPEMFGGFLTLIGSRILQAVGGAMITAIAPAMITVYIPMEQKGKAMGIVMTFAALGTALGPDHRRCPDPVPLLALDLLHQRAGRDRCSPSRGKGYPGSGQAAGPSAGFDRAGAGLIFVGLASLLFVVSEGEIPGLDIPGHPSPCTGCHRSLLAGLCGTNSRLPTRSSISACFKNRNFLLTNLLLFLVFFSFSGINYLLPFYLKYVRNYDTSTAGLILTSLSFAMMGAGILAGTALQPARPPAALHHSPGSP